MNRRAFLASVSSAAAAGSWLLPQVKSYTFSVWTKRDGEDWRRIERKLTRAEAKNFDLALIAEPDTAYWQPHLVSEKSL